METSSSSPRPAEINSATVTNARDVAIGFLKIHNNICQTVCNAKICTRICNQFCPSTCYGNNTITQTPPPQISAASIILAIFAVRKFHRIWSVTRTRPEPENLNPEIVPDDEVELDHPIWYIRTVGLLPSIINEIEVVKYQKENGVIDGTDCAVCLSEFQDDEELRLLPKCKHAFHLPCIDTWLRSHTNCPICRAGVTATAEISVQIPASVDEVRLEIGGGDDNEIATENGGAVMIEREKLSDNVGDEDRGTVAMAETSNQNGIRQWKP